MPYSINTHEKAKVAKEKKKNSGDRLSDNCYIVTKYASC